MSERTGLKVVLQSPIYRAQRRSQGDVDLAFLERLVPFAQTDPEVGMAINKHKGLKSIAAKYDVSHDLFVSEADYQGRIQQAREQEAQQAMADQAKTLANAYQSAARGTANLQDGESQGVLRSLIERGM